MYPLCNDSYLARKGYRKLQLDKHEYVILYQVYSNEVHIGGIFILEKTIQANCKFTGINIIILKVMIYIYSFNTFSTNL